IQAKDVQNGEATFKSIEVLFLLGTRIGLGPIGAHIQAAPVFSFDQNENISYTLQKEWTIYQKSSTGIIGGIGADISSFTVDLRYEHGLSSLNETGNQKIKMWTLGVGFSFL